MLNVKLSPEQRMLQETVRRYLDQTYGFNARERIVGSEQGWSQEAWHDFARFGWLGLPFPERYGGSGGSAIDLLLLLQEFGRALVVEPYVSTVLAGLAVLAGGREEQKERLLPRLVEGELQLALALSEPQSGQDLQAVATVADRTAGGWRLRGHKAVVLGAPSADLLVVSARIDDGAAQALFLVERWADGVRLRSYETIDGRRGAEVLLEGVEVAPQDRLGDDDGGGDASALVERIGRHAALAMVGESVGCLEGAVHQTAQYLNLREQFGQKLASFQALRHRLADMFVLKEEVKALGLWAAGALAEEDPLAAEAVSAAKAYAGEMGRRVCEEAVQLHGAIAITEEYIVGHYLKRLIALDRLFGDSQAHLDRYLRRREDFAT